MKNINITLQPLSLLVGAAIVGVSLVTSGAFTPQGSASDRDVNAIEITNQPNPNEHFGIWEGAPYVVSSGKTFVLLSLGSTNGMSYSQLFFDGGLQLTAFASEYPGNATTIKTVAPGITAPGNTTITVVGNSNANGVAYGYLIDA